MKYVNPNVKTSKQFPMKQTKPGKVPEHKNLMRGQVPRKLMGKGF